MFKAQNRLDETRDARRHLEVADVRLHRTEDAWCRSLHVRGTECSSQCFDFDRVSQRRAGAVGFDIADGRRIDVGYRVCFGDDVGLRGGVRCGVTDLHRTVIVDCRSPDHRVNVVTVVDGGLQRLEYHNRKPATEDGAVGAHVERTAVPGRGHNGSRLVPIAHIVRNADRHTARKGDIAFTVEQALARQVNGDQRRRARGLDGDARTAQIELMRYPRRQKILVVLKGQTDQVDVGALADDRIQVAV